MLPFPTLIHQRQLKQSPHIRPFTRQRNEHRHIHRTILDILPVGIEVNGPIVSSDGESVAGYIFAGTHSLGQRVTSNGELVRAIHRLVYGFGAGVTGIVIDIHDHCCCIWKMIDWG